MKNEGQSRESRFCPVFQSENSIEKAWIYQEWWIFENGTQIFDFCTKNVDISKIMQTWELIGLFFQKLS